MWKSIHSLLGNKINDRNCIKLIHDNIEISNNAQLAEIFNEHFYRLPLSLDQNLPNVDYCPTQFVVSNSQSLFLNPVSPHEVSNTIKTLKNSRQDINSIPVHMLKFVRDEVALVLSEIINLSFTSGVFPECLKLAMVIPIYKTGVKTDVKNYRPISLLPIMSKIFEKIIYRRLYNFFVQNSVFSSSQFGFLKGRSTADAIMALTESVYGSLNSKEHSLAVFIDLSKAFDTVNHKILLKKLELYGVRGLPLKLVESYLSGRRQVVRIGSDLSSCKEISLGVPQGSTLGPLLFLLFINDLPNISSDFYPILFADDTNILFKGSNIDDLVSKCNVVMEKVNDWCNSNRLTINYDKTFYMLFSNRNPTYIPRIMFNNLELDRKPFAKFLGVIIDEKLKFDQHITTVCNKISKAIGIIFKLVNYLDKQSLISIYYSLVHPHLSYCNIVWGNTYWSHLYPLIIAQKKAIRLVNRVNFLDHTNQLFIENKILKLPDLNKFLILVYMFNSDISVYTRNHDHHTRNRLDLLPDYNRLNLTQRSITFCGPSTWNSIPDYVKNSHSLPIFKNRVKNYFIEMYSQS